MLLKVYFELKYALIIAFEYEPWRMRAFMFIVVLFLPEDTNHV